MAKNKFYPGLCVGDKILCHDFNDARKTARGLAAVGIKTVQIKDATLEVTEIHECSVKEEKGVVTKWK